MRVTPPVLARSALRARTSAGEGPCAQPQASTRGVGSTSRSRLARDVTFSRAASSMERRS